MERRTETGAGNKWEWERVKDEWGKDSERGCDTLIISVDGSSICAKGQERMTPRLAFLSPLAVAGAHSEFPLKLMVQPHSFSRGLLFTF